MMIFSNQLINVQIEKSEIPWLKIFTNEKIKELSSCDNQIKLEIFRILDIIEKEMLDYYEPEKINIASFGNYVPHVHFHIMARFKEDSYFPEPMWGEKQRESSLRLPSFDIFCQNIKKLLEEDS
ncbi:MAG: HIT family protein [Arcobacter sp.]|nr:MAG: HIT family protein [Arcobacter sp.]